MIVAARQVVPIIHVVTPLHASSQQTQSVIQVTRIVVRVLVNLLVMARCVGLVLGLVIRRRCVVGRRLLVRLMFRVLMVSLLVPSPASIFSNYFSTSANFMGIGTSCGNSSSLSCASGQCTSRDLQCKTLMGSYTQGNDTYACSSSGCQISCASPSFGAVCYSMQQNFLDGTSCQGGGRCNNGQCDGASVGKEISSWIQENKTLVIALSSTVGGLVVLAVLSCCVSRCRRNRRDRGRKIVSQQSIPPPGWNQPPPGWNGQRQGPSQVPRNGRWQTPNVPPPAWQPSVRYA